MRLLMMGTGPFAVPTFAALVESPHTVVALVTRPAVVGQTRGKTLVPPNPMRQLAEARGVPVFDPANINDPASREWLASQAPDLLVVCDYGQILAEEVLQLAPLGGINLHGSLLPKYRGAAPIQWAIWNGETETGVTVIHMTPGLDAGPCLVQRSLVIGPEETAAELEPRLSQLGVDPVLEAISMLERWDRQSPIGVRQDKSQATRAPRLKKADGEVDWTRSAREIECQSRAVQPWPGLFTHYHRPQQEPLRLILESVRPCPTPAGFSSARAGQLVAVPEGLVVATSHGCLLVPRLQPAGRKMMEVPEFLRGYPLVAGAELGPVVAIPGRRPE